MTSTTGIHPPIHQRYDEATALEQIRNRYRRIREQISRQIELLRDDDRFCEYAEDLYSRGFKDWMILAGILNVMLNIHLASVCCRNQKCDDLELWGGFGIGKNKRIVILLKT